MIGRFAGIFFCIALSMGPAAAESLQERLSEPGSHVLAVFDLPLADLEAVLKARAEGDHVGKRSDAIDLLKDDVLTWRIGLKDLRMTAEQGELLASAPIAGEVHLRGKLGSGFLSVDVSQKAQLKGRMILSMDPVLKSDWTLDPRAQGRVELQELQMKFAGARLNLGGVMQPIINALLQEALAKLADSLSDPRILRKWVEPIWQDACVEKALGVEPNEAFLVVTPRQIAAEPIAVAAERIRVSMILSADSNVALDPGQRSCPPLPDSLQLLD